MDTGIVQYEHTNDMHVDVTPFSEPRGTWVFQVLSYLLV